MTPSSFHQVLHTWFAQNGRDLPWRHTRDPYRILISEMMLQQTQVARVIEKYHEFLGLFPTVYDLAKADRGDVLRAWKGLGYNMRALRLKAAAEEVVNTYRGEFPQEYDALRALPGIGPYTAGAIMSFAYETYVPFADVNIERVVGRIALGPEQLRKTSKKEMAELVATMGDRERTYAYHQAMMDFGAMVCTARTPSCASCPIAKDCASAETYLTHPLILVAKSTKKKPLFRHTDRFWRGRVIDHLRSVPDGANISQICDALSHHEGFDPKRVQAIVAKLCQEGMVQVRGNTYVL